MVRRRPSPTSRSSKGSIANWISFRAAEIAISASLDALSKEQNAQGMHLRGDIVEAQARMRTYLGRMQSAIQAQDAKSARKYLNLAEPEVERLEKFLGR
jgi:hypothetical protein